jgi:hypothetical protein
MEELERLTADYLDGTLDVAGERRLVELLERDPAALAAFVDQQQVHHRLVAVLGDAPPLAAAVVREVRFEPEAPRFAREVVGRIRDRRRASLFFLASAAAGLLAVTGWLVLTPAAPRADVLLVVGRLPLEAGDAAVRTRLERLGFTVEAREASVARDTDAAGRRLVAISSTALAEDLFDASVELRSRFRAVEVPLLTWEPCLYPSLGMIASNEHEKDWAASRNRRRLTILDPSHPMAAGLSGSVDVLTRPGRVSWGRAGASALRIASLDGEPEKVAVFGYEKGAPMDGAPRAPARRVGIFLFDGTAPDLTEAGARLFDAAARWCMETTR